MACFNGAELSLDRPVWAGDVAPRFLGRVWVPAVAVITDTLRRRKDEEHKGKGRRSRKKDKGGKGGKGE